MLINRYSTITGIERQKDIPLDPNDMVMWNDGQGSLQELMPYLTDSEREFILSGITPDEWAKAFMELA
jgi:hypothetical protein